MKKEKIIKTASESTKTSGVQAQPINRTEQKQKNFTGLCSECQKPITEAAIMDIGRNCLIKNYKEFGCLNHGEGKLVIKKNWIGVKNCLQCPKEGIEPDKDGINQIVWEEKPIFAELTKIQGVLTSNLRIRTSTDIPYMAFIRLEPEYEKHSLEECAKAKCQHCEVPVVFRIGKNKNHYNYFGKPNLKKGDKVLLEGKFEHSKKSNRPSFTCYAYQVINSHGK